MPALAAGFADPAHDSQRVFRAVLEAFSHPGRVVRIPTEIEAPAPLGPAATAFLLTLVDRDTPLWFDPAVDSDAVRTYVRFHAGAPIVSDRHMAAFAVVREPTLSGFTVGTDTYPDRSATILIEVPALRGGPTAILRGPGIDGTAAAAIAGLAGSFWQEWAANHALFPCGVDVMFAAGSELLALPRGIAAEFQGEA